MAKVQITQEKILCALEDELKENGYAGVSLKNIAKRAGVNPSLISYHFKNIDCAMNVLTVKYQDMARAPVQYLRDQNPMVFLFAADMMHTIIFHTNALCSELQIASTKQSQLSAYSRFESPSIIWDSLYYETFRKYNKTMDPILFQIMRRRDSSSRREFTLLAAQKDNSLFDIPFWKKVVYSGSTSIFLLAEIPKQIIDDSFEKASNAVDDALTHCDLYQGK